MEAATILGGYGVPTWFFVQSLKSVDTIYREEGRKTLVNSARVQVFFGAQDGEDLKYISDTLGERTEKHKDVSRTQATMFDMHHARTVHVKEVMRPLMRPDEIRTMSRNKCIILPRGSHAIYGTRNFYFADSELVKRAWKPIPAFKETTEAVSKNTPTTTPKIRVPDIISPLRRFTQQDGGGENVLRPRGAVFSSRTGRTASVPTVRTRASIAKQEKQTPPTALPVKLKPINLAALSAAAAGNQIDIQKQALVAKFLNQSGMIAGQSIDREKFERASRKIGEAVDDL